MAGPNADRLVAARQAMLRRFRVSSTDMLLRFAGVIEQRVIRQLVEVKLSLLPVQANIQRLGKLGPVPVERDALDTEPQDSSTTDLKSSIVASRGRLTVLEIAPDSSGLKAATMRTWPR